jgi:hypothetical protein
MNDTTDAVGVGYRPQAKNVRTRGDRASRVNEAHHGCALQDEAIGNAIEKGFV